MLAAPAIKARASDFLFFFVEIDFILKLGLVLEIGAMGIGDPTAPELRRVLTSRGAITSGDAVPQGQRFRAGPRQMARGLELRLFGTR